MRTKTRVRARNAGACLTVGVGIAAGCAAPPLGDGKHHGLVVAPAPTTALLTDRPYFGPAVTLKEAPPPISGGTLAVAPDRVTAIASDPDRDRLYIVDVPSSTVRTIALSTHDEPGRIVVDAHGRAHVALRGSGTLLTVELATGATLRRRACIAPRGVAYDGSNDQVVLVCAEGQLVRFPSDTGDAVMRATVAPDLRDVVVRKNGDLVVSTFRSASMLHLDSQANVLDVSAPAAGQSSHVMWRMAALDLGDGQERVVAAAQRPREGKLPAPTAVAASGSYGTSTTSARCDPGVVSGEIRMGAGGHIENRHIQLMPQATLPIDIATEGALAVVLAAGNTRPTRRSSSSRTSRYRPATITLRARRTAG